MGRKTILYKKKLNIEFLPICRAFSSTHNLSVNVSQSHLTLNIKLGNTLLSKKAMPYFIFVIMMNKEIANFNFYT
jgi:hypothetical protein